MLKNLIAYRMGPGWSPNSAELLAALEKAPFVSCGPTQAISTGFIPPRGVAHAPLLESVNNQWLMKLMVEQRTVPGAVVKRVLQERVAKIEEETGRKPGKKQKKELTEEIVLSLLPQAFPKQATVTVWLDPKARLLLIDSGSAARADEIVTLFVRALDGLALAPVHTAQSPALCMSTWLTTGEPPPQFTVDRELQLKAPDESKAAVRYARHALDIDEVRQHIASGKLPTMLALTWNGRVSFKLLDDATIHRIEFLEGVFEGAKPGKDEAFDTDAAIATGELSRLLPDLLDALGGEKLPGEEQKAA